jgi:hypothetical protein
MHGGAEGTQAVKRAFTTREPAGEESIYRALTGICECVISVSHRPSLIKYHQSHLELNGSGGWALEDVGVEEGEPGGGACTVRSVRGVYSPARGAPLVALVLCGAPRRLKDGSSARCHFDQPRNHTK